jgi:hypothetical protein
LLNCFEDFQYDLGVVVHSLSYLFRLSLYTRGMILVTAAWPDVATR